MLPYEVMVTITNDRSGQAFVLARVPSWRPAHEVSAAFVRSRGWFELVDLKVEQRELSVVIGTDKAWEELGLEGLLV